jgi:hypothetical protein
MRSREPAALIILVLVVAARAGDDPAQSPRAKAMREIASGLAVATADGQATYAMADDPIYRFNDPARSFSDGTTWAFGKDGRPAALLTLALERKQEDGSLQWVCEWTSLSHVPLRASDRSGNVLPPWSPTEPGVTWKALPNTPAPSDDKAKRLRQMREIARRFKANEYFRPTANAREERYELRTLANPVHRYAEPKNDVTDGAIFLVAYGQNPEIVLVIEARVVDRRPSWVYGLARISGARVNVLLDDKPVAEFEAWPTNNANAPYRYFGIPAPNMEK